MLRPNIPKKDEDKPPKSVKTPPINGPIPKPANNDMLNVPIYSPSLFLGARSAIKAIDIGVTIAEATPCANLTRKTLKMLFAGIYRSEKML